MADATHSPARLSRAQSRRIDQLALQRYHIPGIVLMENAARAAADLALRMLEDVPRSAPLPTTTSAPTSPLALILCGGGNNGGDGLAIARHLHNRGVDVSIALTIDPAKYTGDAKINFDIVRAMNLPLLPFNASSPDPVTAIAARSDLVIDAIFGTGLDRPPRTPFDTIAAIVNGWKKPILAIDVPSGLDCDTGRPFGACIAATRTITFVAEKIGFADPGSLAYTGPVAVGDIGSPRELLAFVLTSESGDGEK